MNRDIDERIFALLQSDKAKGIRMLFDRYYCPLVVYVSSRFPVLHVQAEDMVQDFFVRLWEDDYLLKIRPEGLPAYLFTSVRNLSLTALKKKDILSDALGLDDGDMPSVAVCTDDERIDKVMKALEILPPRTREAVDCVILRGMKYKEAAEEMDISVNTVKYLLKDAMHRLRALCSPQVLEMLVSLFRPVPRNLF